MGSMKKEIWLIFMERMEYALFNLMSRLEYFLQFFIYVP